MPGLLSSNLIHHLQLDSSVGCVQRAAERGLQGQPPSRLAPLTWQPRRAAHRCPATAGGYAAGERSANQILKALGKFSGDPDQVGLAGLLSNVAFAWTCGAACGDTGSRHAAHMPAAWAE